MLQQTFNTLIYASIYALFAMGYALVFGVLDILNLAHGAIFMIGAFAAVQTVLGWHWPLWLALPFGDGRRRRWLGCCWIWWPWRRCRRAAGRLPHPADQHHRAPGSSSRTSLWPSSGRTPIASRWAPFPEGQITIGDAVVQPGAALHRGLTVVLDGRPDPRAPLQQAWQGDSCRGRQSAGGTVAGDRRAAAPWRSPSSWPRPWARSPVSVRPEPARMRCNWDMGGSIQLRGLAVIVVGGMDSIPGVMLGSLLLAASETDRRGIGSARPTATPSPSGCCSWSCCPPLRSAGPARPARGVACTCLMQLLIQV